MGSVSGAKIGLGPGSLWLKRNALGMPRSGGAQKTSKWWTTERLIQAQKGAGGRAATARLLYVATSAEPRNQATMAGLLRENRTPRAGEKYRMGTATTTTNIATKENEETRSESRTTATTTTKSSPA